MDRWIDNIAKKKIDNEICTLPIYELSDTGIKRLKKTTFADRGLRERQDIQRLLKDAVITGTLVASGVSKRAS